MHTVSYLLRVDLLVRFLVVRRVVGRLRRRRLRHDVLRQLKVAHHQVHLQVKLVQALGLGQLVLLLHQLLQVVLDLRLLDLDDLVRKQLLPRNALLRTF